MAWGEIERAALVQTFRQTDPDGPTLCEGWNARRLLAHLVVREHTPWLRVADALRRPQPGDERSLTALCAQAQTPEGYEALVRRFAGGTSKANPFTWLGDAGQLVEYTLHHEDLRRGVPSAPPEPRELPEGQLAALWRTLPFLARMAFRTCPVGVVLLVPGGGRKPVRKGAETVVLSGGVVELLLATSGRRRAAKLDVGGPDAAVARFEEWAAGRPGGL